MFYLKPSQDYTDRTLRLLEWNNTVYTIISNIFEI